MAFTRLFDLLNEPLAIEEGKFQALLEFRAAYLARGPFSPEEVRQRIGAVERPRMSRTPTTQVGSVAMIPLNGVLMPKANMLTDISGATSMSLFRADLRAAARDKSISTIVIDTDSPGGSVEGIEEAAEDVRRARSQKPVVAHVNGQAASAAYWIISGASAIIATPSGSVGSIGVIGTHTDLSEAERREGIKTTLVTAGRFKGEGHPSRPLSDDALKSWQARVDSLYQIFVNDVATGRQVSADVVKRTYGEGRVVSARDGLRLGMVDRLQTFDALLSDLVGRGPVGLMARAEKDIEEEARLLEGFDHFDHFDRFSDKQSTARQAGRVNESAAAEERFRRFLL